MNELDSLMEQYRSGAAMTGSTNPDIANAGHTQLHTAYKQLRQTESGQSAISSLMMDENPYGRLWAAAHFLRWRTDEARDILVQLVRSKGAGSFDAEMTLQEFDSGTLTFDY